MKLFPLFLTIIVMLTGCETRTTIRYDELVKIESRTKNLTGYKLYYIGSDKEYHYIYHRVLDRTHDYRIPKNDLIIPKDYYDKAAKGDFVRLDSIRSY